MTAEVIAAEVKCNEYFAAEIITTAAAGIIIRAITDAITHAVHPLNRHEIVIE